MLQKTEIQMQQEIMRITGQHLSKSEMQLSEMHIIIFVNTDIKTIILNC